MPEGQLATVLKVLEENTEGTFHGLGSLVAKQRGGKPSVQGVLNRDFEIPVRVLAEPRYWYSMHRKPAIAEVNDTKDRVLVRFVTHGISGSFQGTCLYALRDGEWGCYTIKLSASETTSTAEKWLDEHDWEAWG